MQSWKWCWKLCWRSWQWPLWLCVEVLKTLLVPISSSKCSNLIQIGCWVSFTAFLVGNCVKLFNMCKLKFFPLKILKKKVIKKFVIEPLNLKLHTQLHFGSFSNLCVKTFIPLLLVLPIAHPRFFFRNSFLVDVGYCVRACLYRHITALALCSLALTHTRILGQLPPMQVLGGLFSESSSSWRANQQQPVQHASCCPPSSLSVHSTKLAPNCCCFMPQAGEYLFPFGVCLC